MPARRRPTNTRAAKTRTTPDPITPVQLGRGTTHVVVYGGSFDPPHLFHRDGPAEAVTRALPASVLVLYVPAARSPLKDTAPSATDAQRVAMLKSMLRPARRRTPRCSVWTDELDRARRAAARGNPTASYTIDTVRRLRRALPADVTLRLLIGADQAVSFHRWKDFRELIDLAEPLVMPRGEIADSRSLAEHLDRAVWTPAEIRAWKRRFVPMSTRPPSSTSVRQRAATAPDDPTAWEDLEGLHVPAPVARYIIRHGLYGRAHPARVTRSHPTKKPRALNPRPRHALPVAGEDSASSPGVIPDAAGGRKSRRSTSQRR